MGPVLRTLTAGADGFQSDPQAAAIRADGRVEQDCRGVAILVGQLYGSVGFARKTALPFGSGFPVRVGPVLRSFTAGARGSEGKAGGAANHFGWRVEQDPPGCLDLRFAAFRRGNPLRGGGSRTGRERPARRKTNPAQPVASGRRLLGGDSEEPGSPRQADRKS